METAAASGQKTLIFVIYVGEGGLDLRCLNTYACLPKSKTFAIEHFVRQLALIKNSYVVSYFECLRSKISIQDGYTQRPDSGNYDRNLIMIFSSQPLVLPVASEACTAAKFVQELAAQGKEVCLPEALLYQSA